MGACYIGPAWDHYRCLKFQVTTTCGIHVSGQYKLYPQHSHVTIETPKDKATRITKDIIEAVKGLQDQEKNHPERHTQALEAITKISKIQKIYFLKGHCPNPKPPQTQRNRTYSVSHQETINGSHNPTHQDSYRPYSKTI